LLDVGGGDGAPLNYLLELRADVRVTTIDIAPEVGQWLDPKHAARVVRMPRTDIGRYLASGQPHPDVLLLSDVMHHIPASEREVFLASLSELLRLSPDVRIIVKDVEPGFARSLLGYWADKYITGDKAVRPIAQEELISLVQNSIGPMRYEATDLFAVDKPNYALVFFK
jgi:2-polyprenyl-3-methyl-5-hydroxy-6-metoxy-1,4-benzoquinol methylase